MMFIVSQICIVNLRFSYLPVVNLLLLFFQMAKIIVLRQILQEKCI